MPKKYNKKLNITLTTEDADLLAVAAAEDRRSTAQYTSILLEAAVANLRDQRKKDPRTKAAKVNNTIDSVFK